MMDMILQVVLAVSHLAQVNKEVMERTEFECSVAITARHGVAQRRKFPDCFPIATCPLVTIMFKYNRIG